MSDVNTRSMKLDGLEFNESVAQCIENIEIDRKYQYEIVDFFYDFESAEAHNESLDKMLAYPYELQKIAQNIMMVCVNTPILRMQEKQF